MKAIKFSSIIGAATLAIALLVGSGNLMAQQGPNAGPGKQIFRAKMMNMQKQNFEPGMRIKAMLDLSDEQFEQIKALRLKHQKNCLPVRNEIGEKRAHLRTLMTAEKTDMRAINKQIDEIAKLRAEQMKLRAAHHQAIRALLTDEQRIKFDTMKNRMGKGMRMKGMKGRKYGCMMMGNPQNPEMGLTSVPEPDIEIEGF